MRKLSRSRVDLFVNCQRCSYLQEVKKIKRPPGFPYSINSAVDKLLKSEFDCYRAEGKAHPLQTQFGVDAIPAQHALIDQWRYNFTGVQYKDTLRDVLWFGAIDDLWVNNSGEYHVVDYKATAKNEPVVELADWTIGYKRQMEFYQFLLRKNGLRVSNTSYFVYCTGNPNHSDFSDKVHFRTHVIPYVGDDSWVEPVLDKMVSVLSVDHIPDSSLDCDYCQFVAKHKNLNS